MNILIIVLVIIIFNLPFGYWRSLTKKFSVQWFLAVHLLVPFVIFIRIKSGMSILWFPVTFGAYFIGQFYGGKMGKKFAKQIDD